MESKIQWCSTKYGHDSFVCGCHSNSFDSATEADAWEWADSFTDSYSEIIDGVEYLYCGYVPLKGCGCDCIIAERKAS